MIEIVEGSFHPLFPPEDEHHKPQPIKAIYVKRFETSGLVSALRPFEPAELMSEQDIFAMFGGGTYQLQARGERGEVYRTVRVTIPGSKKSMLGDVGASEEEAAPVARPSASTGGPVTSFDFMQMQLAEMREERRAAKEREEKREDRERERDARDREREREERKQREDDQRNWMLMLVDVMKGGSGLTERLLEKALTPNVAAAAPRDPITDAKAVIELTKAIKKGGAETSEETISTVAQAIGMGLNALAELAKAGNDKPQQQQQQQLGQGQQQQQQQQAPESHEQPQQQQQGAVG